MIQHSNTPNVVYGDESSFNLWMRPTKTWGRDDGKTKIEINIKRGKSITLYGAIGEMMTKPVFMQGRSTNTDEFCKFLKLVRQNFSDNSRIYLVLDNHPTHKSVAAKILAEELNITFTMLTPYSPEFNSIERLWGYMKKEFKNIIKERHYNI